MSAIEHALNAIRGALARQDLAEAEALAKALVQAEPDEAEAWHGLAQVAWRCGQAEAAFAALGQARLRQPGEGRYLLIAGQWQLARRDYAKAYALFQVLARSARLAVVDEGLGRAAWGIGAYDESVAAFARAAEAAPREQAPSLGLARSLLQLARRVEGVAVLERLLALQPDALEARLLLAYAYFDGERPEAARACLQALMARQPAHEEAVLLAAVLTELEGGPCLAPPEDAGQARTAARIAGLRFLREHGARLVGLPTDVLEAATAAVSVAGHWVECGVYHGRSLNLLAARTDGFVHGFDSFQGLPEAWKPGEPRGSYSTGGSLPTVAANVRLHQGWFEHTLGPFLAGQSEPVALLHVDCDIYSSTRTVLEHFAPRLVPGSVLLFDDLLGYPGYEAHEFKAWHELAQRQGLCYRWLAGSVLGREAAVLITEH